MKSIKDYFDKIFEGINLTEKEKSCLLGLYLLEFYKSSFEIMLDQLGGNQVFLNQLNGFFDESLKLFSQEKLKKYQELLEEEKVEIVAHLITTSQDILPPELRQKIETNLSKIKNQAT